MSNIKLSFIVPVYNVAPYLRKCVDSLLAQDYDYYEIILVDDGSTDESGAICDEYAASSLSAAGTSPFSEADHSIIPIRVIHQVNAGLSAARNSGILAARGEYLCFVDSDDYWEPNVLDGLMAQIERDKLDVLRFDYQNVRIKDKGEYEVFEPNKAPKRDVDYNVTVTDGETFLNERLGPACYAVMFILRRDLIIGGKPSPNSLIHSSVNPLNNTLFTPDIYFEDTEWTPRMLLRAKRVASTSKVVYNYLCRPGSITLPTDSLKRKKVLEDKIRLIRCFKEQSNLVRNPEWFIWMTSSMVISILGMLAKLPVADRKPYLDDLKSLHLFPLSTKKEKMLIHKMKIILANISPALYCAIMSLRK